MIQSSISEKLSTPTIFHREYENDLPKRDTVNSRILQQGLRATQIALPLFSLYKPLGQPLAIVLGATRVVSSFAQFISGIEANDPSTTGKNALEVAIASTALACSILAHPLGMVVTTAHDMILNVVQLTRAIQAGDHKKAAEIGLHLANNALYLSCFFAGSLELSIASIGFQSFIGLYSSSDTFRKAVHEFQVGNNSEGWWLLLESSAHLLMAGIRGKEMRDQVHMLQTQQTLQISRGNLDTKDRKFLETVELLLQKDPETLDLSAQLVTDAQMALLGEILPSSNVKTLNLSNNLFKHTGMRALATALPKTQIKSLNLSSTSGCALEELIKILPQTQIQTFDLYDAHVRDKELNQLIHKLPQTKILDLNLGYNKISDSGFEDLMLRLPLTNVRTLHLAGNKIRMEDEEVVRAFKYAMAQGHLIQLNLSDNYVEDRLPRALAKVLPFSKIQELSLSGCGIGADGIQRLSSSLASSKLRALDLSTNYLGSGGLIALSQALPHCGIQRLNLDFDQKKFDSKSLEVFKNAVIGSKILSLSFGFNEIGTEGAKIFAEILEKGSLETLSLRCDRSIGSKGTALIAEALKHSSLKQLCFNSNDIGDQGCIAIATAIPFTHLEWIDLSLNNITDASVQALLATIKPSLKHIRLEENAFSDTSKRRLASHGQTQGVSILL